MYERGSGGNSRDVNAELAGHLEDNSEQLAEFLASKSRLQERMAGARRDMHRLRAVVADDQRQFDAALQHLRNQVAALIEPSRSPPRPAQRSPPAAASSSTLDKGRFVDDPDDSTGSWAPPSTPCCEEV
jgi:hypothetical protein